MSFLKKLFGSKDYGKGHRLGDPSTPRAQAQASHEFTRPQYVSEASIAAGQAALARAQQQKPTPRQHTSLKQDEKRQIEAHERVMNEAEALKQHYFGDNHIKQLEKSSHLDINKIRVLFKSAIVPETLQEPCELVDIQNKIIDKLLANLNDEPILTSLTLLVTKATYTNKSEAKLNKCIDIIKKIITNIIQNPAEEKYRKIRAENGTIKEDLLSFEYSDFLLNNVGFQLLQQNNENIYLFDAQNEENFTKLTHLNESFEYVEAIVPEMDRCLRVIRMQDSSQNENKFELSSDFFSHNLNDIKREQKQREEALTQMSMLRTKAMRERDAKLEIRKYNYCLIRIKFSNNYYLQALFKAQDCVQQLYICVQDCLVDATIQFELKTHHLKDNFDSKMTFAECGLTPASLLHFYAPNNVSNNSCLLKAELLNNAQDHF